MKMSDERNEPLLDDLGSSFEAPEARPIESAGPSTALLGWLRQSPRRVTFFALLLIAVSLPLGSIAEANHGTRTLQVFSEITSAAVGSSVTVTATVYTADGSAASPADTGFPIDVDLEITGPGDPDSSDTPGSPDQTCPIPGGSATCTMTFSSTQTGTSLVRAWIADASIDSAEGRISDNFAPGNCVQTICTTPTNTTTDCISPDPPTYCDSSNGVENPGSQAERDQTDVVEVRWNTGTPAKLDCNPEQSTNPSAGSGSTANFVCKVTDSLDNTISGTNIDGENMGGANDPDNSGTPSATNTTADYTQNASNYGAGCTTGSDGSCTASITPNEGEAGLTDICFWADTNSDNTFSATGSADGGGCGEAVTATENADLTDKVQVDWGHPRINCDPESSTNPTAGTGSTASFVCTAHNESGDPVSEVRIDGENMGGPNDPDNSGTPSVPTNTTADYTQTSAPQGMGCTTGAGATCTATVAAFEGQAGPAEICFWADTNNPADDAFGPAINDGGYCATETVGDPEFDNSTDKVLETWQSRAATYLDVRLENATSDLGTTYTVTATVYDQFGATFAGFTDVKFEFFSGSPSDGDGNTPGSPDKSCTTPNSSACSVSYTQATVTGTDLICAWIGSTPTMTGTNAGGTCNGEGLTDPTNEDAAPSPPDDRVDVVQKQWTPAAAATIVLTPATATNPVGTTHTVTATVTDQFGNNVADGTVVTFTVTGKGATVATRTTTGGTATFGFTSTQTGSSSVTATSGSATSNTASKTWTAGAASTVTLQPSTDTNPINTTHTVTATVTDAGGNPVSGTVVTFSVAGTGAETPAGATKTTNASGQATFDFNSTKTGTSTITATSGGASGTATKTWTAGTVSTLTLEPATETNPPNTTHTVTATVTDGFGNRVPDVTVTFTVTGTGAETPKSAVKTTNANGQATFDFRSTATGTSTITATVSGASPATATKTWAVGAAVSITLEPTDDTNNVGTTHVVTATVKDAGGNAVSGQLLVGDKHECLDETCTSIGPFTEGQTRTTDANGQATFTFNSSRVGRFVIHVYADNDPSDGTPPPEPEDTPRASAFKSWICGPFNGPYFANLDIARDIALLPGEDCMGYVLDGFGARHPFGGAPNTNGGPYFAGFDIARAIVINPAGTGGFVLDGFGARHPFGIGANPPPPTPTDGPYFAGFDIANDLILTGASKGYVLDGFGARHPWGGAPATTGGPYFSGNDIARAFDMFPASDGSPGYVLDGFGARHPFNGAAAQSNGLYFPGNDIARDIVMTGAGQGYVLDGFGARHPFGGQAPSIGGPYFPGFDIARAFAISGNSGIVLEGFGGLHTFGVP